MLRAWLLTLDILIRVGLVKLPQQDRSKELEPHHCNLNKDKHLYKCCDPDIDDAK